MKYEWFGERRKTVYILKGKRKRQSNPDIKFTSHLLSDI